MKIVYNFTTAISIAMLSMFAQASILAENCQPFDNLKFEFANENLDQPKVIYLAGTEEFRVPMLAIKQNEFKFDAIFDTAVLRVDSIDNGALIGEVRYEQRQTTSPIECDTRVK